MAKLKLSFPTLRQPASVVCGTGSLSALRDAANLDQTVYFLSAQESVKTALERVLERANCKLTADNHLFKSVGEPTSETIHSGGKFLKGKSIKRIVGIGGGSTLDWCRLALADARGALDLASGQISFATDERLPELWLIPTTPATGAEAAQVAVYLHETRKLAAASPAFIANQVVLDGRFLDSMSAESLAASVCDTLSHGVEAFCSIVPNNLATEAALSSLQLVLRNFGDQLGDLPSKCRNERLLEAGFLGGVAASNCSVGVVHAFAHSVAYLDIPHSLGNALGLVAGLRINADTPAIRNLVARLGHRKVNELIAEISVITSLAIRTHAALPGIKLLAEQATRRSVVERMLGDVCLRSNPQSLNEDALEQFLTYVDQAIESA